MLDVSGAARVLPVRCDAAATGVRRPSRRAGYSLLELLCVMIGIAIFSTMAVPSMMSMVRGARLESARQGLIGDLRLARMEAIRRNTSISLTVTNSTTYTVDSIGTRTLKEKATFSGSPAMLTFSSYGPLKTGAIAYTLQLGGKTTTVSVSAAGHASAQ
jgi:type IV fimbrial biogenesis protein FimT